MENKEQNFHFNLLASEANTIMQALSHFPYKEVAPLIQKIQHQIVGQLPVTEMTDEGKAQEKS
jgi:hypothetical protein